MLTTRSHSVPFFCLLAAFMPSVLDGVLHSDKPSLFKVDVFPSVEAETTHLTHTHRPTKCVQGLPVSLTMGAQRTDPRLNPGDVCKLW